MNRLATISLAALAVLAAAASGHTEHTYDLGFDHPMSWSDDVALLNWTGVQQWEIAPGGNPGGALRIDGSAYQRTRTSELRTLQVNHQPGTPVTISFDFRAKSCPDGAYFLARYFDGYCGGQAFYRSADDPFRPFPKPFFDTRDAGATAKWIRVSFTTPPLKNSVITIALYAVQNGPETETAVPEYLDFYLDNLKVSVTPTDTLLDPDFNWHGNYGSTTGEFRWNTLAADSDWCDFADQETEEGEEGNGIIRYTLFQFRDQSRQELANVRHMLQHEQHSLNAGGASTVTLFRHMGAGNLSAVSWGVRQTVGYKALGLDSGQNARLRLTMKYTNIRHGNRSAKVQMGVDPAGGLETRRAQWGELDGISLREDPEPWRIGTLEFDRPENAEAFTIYFRQRDGLPQAAKDRSYPKPPTEAQSQGGSVASESMVDWVTVEVVK